MKHFTHEEAVTAAAWFASHYGVFTSVGDIKYPPNSSCEDYSYFAVREKQDDLDSIATIGSQWEIERIQKMAAIIFPIDHHHGYDLDKSPVSKEEQEEEKNTRLDNLMDAIYRNAPVDLT